MIEKIFNFITKKEVSIDTVLRMEALNYLKKDSNVDFNYTFAKLKNQGLADNFILEWLKKSETI